MHSEQFEEWFEDVGHRLVEATNGWTVVGDLDDSILVWCQMFVDLNHIRGYLLRYVDHIQTTNGWYAVAVTADGQRHICDMFPAPAQAQRAIFLDWLNGLDMEMPAQGDGGIGIVEDDT